MSNTLNTFIGPDNKVYVLINDKAYPLGNPNNTQNTPRPFIISGMLGLYIIEDGKLLSLGSSYHPGHILKCNSIAYQILDTIKFDIENFVNAISIPNDRMYYLKHKEIKKAFETFKDNVLKKLFDLKIKKDDEKHKFRIQCRGQIRKLFDLCDKDWDSFVEFLEQYNELDSNNFIQQLSCKLDMLGNKLIYMDSITTWEYLD